MPSRPTSLTVPLEAEYRRLWSCCEIRKDCVVKVRRQGLQVAANEERYRKAGKASCVPWPFVGIVHMMEGGCDFTTHMHNGDPLTERTVHVPMGRPPEPLQPPFTWEQSAADALKQKGLEGCKDWSVPGLLYQFERYNGWGYRIYHPDVKSPYLWSGSNHYTAGKYVSDGVWSAVAVSRQIGAAVLLKWLIDGGYWQASV